MQSLVDEARASKRRAPSAPAVKRARQLRPEEIEALVAHYRHNGSVVAAAKALGITRQTAGKHLADAGIMTVRRIGDADIAIARAAHAAGASVTAIGRRLGFSANTILKVVTGERVA